MSEEGEQKSVFDRYKKYMDEAPFFCKIFQLIMCMVSFGLILAPFNNGIQEDLHRAGVVYVSTGGFVLINAILIVCYLYGEKMPKKMSIMFAGMGAILCFFAGLILIYDWSNFQSNMISLYLERYLNQMLSSGIFAILAALAFAVDVFLINKCE